ncbi:MAG: class I SAM-dependent methyltransferase, partial [Pseudomonadota bacterium]
MAEPAVQHSELMNATYRRQRWIYDATRKYYLFGRDHLIKTLDPPEGSTVLEIACGTGRNLQMIHRQYPTARLYGLDISSEMLRSASAKLGQTAQLAEADACDFDPETLFGVAHFDRIVLSYALSMIPDWPGALREALDHLAPGGSLHIVDFGTQNRLPKWFRGALRHWLGKFHVSPRDALPAQLSALTSETGTQSDAASLYRGYAQHLTARRPL